MLMKKRIQTVLWILVLLYSMLALIFDHRWGSNASHDYNNPLPRLLVFYFWLLEIITNRFGFIVGLFWGACLCSGGFIAFFGIPAVFAFRKTTRKLVVWDLVFLMLLCLIDVVGCLFYVQGDYHPHFSVMMDCFILSLSFWSIVKVT